MCVTCRFYHFTCCICSDVVNIRATGKQQAGKVSMRVGLLLLIHNGLCKSIANGIKLLKLNNI